MTDGKFVLYTRKMIKNPLMRRKQLQVEMIHPDMPNVSKAAMKDKLATLFKSKSENIAIYGCQSKFGGGRSTGFALIYDSLDDRKKFDSKTNLLRDGMRTKAKVGRKQKKEIKGRMNKVRGIAKAAAAAAGGKKKK